MQPVQDLISERFSRLKLKDDPIQLTNTVTEDEIIQFQRHIHEMFPDMDINQLQKFHTNKIESNIQWKKLHCGETH